MPYFFFERAVFGNQLPMVALHLFDDALSFVRRLRYRPASIMGRALLFVALVMSLPWSDAQTLWYGGNFTAEHPGGRGLTFGGGTNGDVNAIECMEKPNWRYVSPARTKLQSSAMC